MSKVTEDLIGSAERAVTQLIAIKSGVSDSMVGVFSDFEALMVELMAVSSPKTGRIIAAGHVTAEIQLAAHKADKTLVEVVGTSPFTSHVDGVLSAISDETEVIYLANPNRISGADWSLADLEQLALAIPDGLLIIDEYYHDYYGISADPLLTQYSNVVVLRSPAPAAGLPGTFGYMISSPRLVDQYAQSRVTGNLTSSDLSTLTECLYDTEQLYTRLRLMHDEALRMIGEMRTLGFQCRLTPYDRLLVKVGNAAVAGNHLAAHKVEVENLDGYPGLTNQIRIAVGLPSTNDRTLDAFRKLTAGGTAAGGRKRQTLELRRKPEQEALAELSLPPARLERVKAFAHDDANTEKVVSR